MKIELTCEKCDSVLPGAAFEKDDTLEMMKLQEAPLLAKIDIEEGRVHEMTVSCLRCGNPKKITFGADQYFVSDVPAPNGATQKTLEERVKLWMITPECKHTYHPRGSVEARICTGDFDLMHTRFTHEELAGLAAAELRAEGKVPENESPTFNLSSPPWLKPQVVKRPETLWQAMKRVASSILRD